MEQMLIKANIPQDKFKIRHRYLTENGILVSL